MTPEKPLREVLRQMLALLEGERQALAGLDLERILTCADGKLELCEQIERRAQGHLDEESRGLLDAVARLNEINRKLRNLIAANVEARLSALTGRVGVYGGGRQAAVLEMPR
jgi:hypothetical protein